MESFTEHTHHLRHCKSVPDFHDDFKIRTRSNRLFALWIANLLGLNHEASEAYSEDLQMFDFYQGSLTELVEKAQKDLSDANIVISEEHLLSQMAHFRELVSASLTEH